MSSVESQRFTVPAVSPETSHTAGPEGSPAYANESFGALFLGGIWRLAAVCLNCPTRARALRGQLDIVEIPNGFTVISTADPLEDASLARD